MAKALKWSCGEKGRKQAVEFRGSFFPWAQAGERGAVGAGRPGWVGVRVSAVWGRGRGRGTRAWGLWRVCSLKRAAHRGQSLGFSFCVGEGPGRNVLPGAEETLGESLLVVKQCRTPQGLKSLKTLGFRGPDPLAAACFCVF